MRKQHTWLISVFSVLVVVGLFLGGNFYLSSVRDSLWLLSVTDLRQVTTQASHAFEVYLEKDLQNIHIIAVGIEKVSSNEIRYIEERLRAYNDVSDSNFYTVVDLEQGVFYSTEAKEFCSPMPESRLEVYRSFSGSGIEEPTISESNGLRILNCYECFQFSDGVRGVICRAVPTSKIVEEFSLSVYDGEGFSYIVNQKGDILLRSIHRDSNHTYQNVFDAMSMESKENSSSQSVIDHFRTAMSDGSNGVVHFTTVDGAQSIYAFVPIKKTDGWYYITVVSSNVLLEQSNHILNISQFLLLIIAIGIFVLLIVLILIRKNHKAIEKIEQEVQYREQLFDILTNSTGDAFVMFTIKEKTVEYVSPNIEYLLGISVQDIKKDAAVLLEADCTHTDFDKKLAKLETGGSFFMEQERIHRETGERGWFAVTVYRVRIEDIDKAVMVLSNRTVEKEKERALEDAMNIAEAANRAKSMFLSSMSHDIRTPMNAIIGFCTLIQRDAENPERVRDYTKKMLASGQHLLGLINDVLDMSKIEAGKTVLNISEINLAEIVDELVTVLMPQSKAKHQSFEVCVVDVKSEHLLGDKLRINQILINILSNAIKYTPVGGRVEMIIRQMPQTSKNFAHMRFIVKDNGIGMAPEYMDTIFHAFTREINSQTNKIQGTGLGMAITKGLVELMEGNISVESMPEQGSTFTVDLDLRIQDRDVNQNFWKEHGVTQLLVVDDEEEICVHVVNTMEGTGVSVQYALNGLSAISMVEQGHEADSDFDLVLLDWKMPEMDGIETARRIRAMLPRKIPILILSAYDWTEIEEEALSVGIDGFLPKPFFLSNFELTIEKLCGEDTDAIKEDEGELHGMHILAAEDNELNAEILRELLEMLGASCDIEENGEKVLEHFRISKPGEYDLILMDVQMPIMNGYEATRAIRACEHVQAADIPIIAMTADAFAEDIRRAIKSGMNAHVAKPIDLKRLEQAVKEVKRKIQG